MWNGKDHSIRSILMVTHNIEEAVEMADRVIVFGSHPGRIVAQVPVNLPRPRERHSADFEARVDYLYSVMTGAQQEKAANAGHTTVEAEEAERTDNKAGTSGSIAEKRGTSKPVEREEAIDAGAANAENKPHMIPEMTPEPSPMPQHAQTDSLSSAISGVASTAAGADLPSAYETEGQIIKPDAAAIHGGSDHVHRAHAGVSASSETDAARSAQEAFADNYDAADTPTTTMPAPKRMPDGQQFMPNATPGGLAGLLDVLAENPDGIDLADLASLLSFEVDDLFPLIDAGAMLEVLDVHDGRAQLTEAGWQWHDADILGSKTVFARLALQHAPLVRTIDHALKQSKSGRLRGELIVDLLRSRHEDIKARQQFRIAVTWGRYGELFDYDADDDMLILDEENR